MVIFKKGHENLYMDIIEPLGHAAKNRNEEIERLFQAKLNILTSEFSSRFLKQEGSIDWNKLIAFNSEKVS